MRGRHWEEGRVLWPHTHLSVLLLQWRRAAFPRQVSGTISLGVVLGPGTSAGDHTAAWLVLIIEKWCLRVGNPTSRGFWSWVRMPQ